MFVWLQLQDLKVEIAGAFQEDLYHRLAVILIKVPALNDRRDDIPMLILILRIRLLLSKECSQKFSSAAINLLKEYDWTGNIVNYEMVERLIILGGSEIRK
jgi:DNA-binding NtrC family response regulator